MEKVLFLKGDCLAKIRGGNRLRNIDKNFKGDNIGEYRAISGMKDHPSTIINGKFKGEKLDKVYRENKELFNGEKLDSFPLLVKLIDAQDDLSIQVHPDDEMAKEVENSSGKTECRYILNENPAAIIYGLKVATKEEAIKLIDERKRGDLLREVPTHRGDFFFVPSGTVHAIKRGSLILEIQQSSDVTYRLYDYDRKDKNGNLRPLHLEKAKRAIKINKLDNQIKSEKEGKLEKSVLTSNQYFEVIRYKIKDLTSFTRKKPYMLECVTGGSGELLVDEKTYPIKKGDFFILTSACQAYSFKGDLEIVQASVN